VVFGSTSCDNKPEVEMGGRGKNKMEKKECNKKKIERELLSRQRNKVNIGYNEHLVITNTWL
jgi:hypothetical protein